MGERLAASEVIALVTDTGSFSAWDTDVVSDDPLGFADTVAYRERLATAEQRSGARESVVTGQARVHGHDVVVIVGEFGFLAGTLGVASAERVVRAFERAGDLGLPVLGMPTSGGTRMQEGTLAFIQMAGCAAAVQRFRAKGLTYVAYLRHPTTGGVLASWGSLGHVTLAEPAALIGLTGPRVIEQLTGTPFPEDVQVAENLRDHGVLDDVVPVADLASRVARVLAVTATPPQPWQLEAAPLGLSADAAVDGWAAVQRSRRTDRPGIRELLAVCATEMTPLRGDGAGVDDTGCLAAFARVCGVPAVIVAHDRPPGSRGAQLGVAGYRKARRAMALAEELGLPVITVIDTAGVQISVEAEEAGLAAEIARSLAVLADISTPTLSVLLGEGSGGGAIAWLPADRVLAAEHSWLAPIAPEGASSILYRTPERAAELASAQATSSTDLLRVGIVDVVVADRPPPGQEGPPFADRVAATAARELKQLVDRDRDERVAARAHRYRTIGRHPVADGGGADAVIPPAD